MFTVWPLERPDYRTLKQHAIFHLASSLVSAITTSLDEIRKVFDTNFFGSINVTQAFFYLLQQSSAPRIVNVIPGLASFILHNDVAGYIVKYALLYKHGPRRQIFQL